MQETTTQTSTNNLLKRYESLKKDYAVLQKNLLVSSAEIDHLRQHNQGSSFRAQELEEWRNKYIESCVKVFFKSLDGS
jgi:hypothetical protein